MPFIPVPDGIKCCMRFSIAGQQCCNIFYVTSPDPITLPLLDGLGAAIKTWWTSNIKPHVVNQLSLNAIELTDASVAGGLGIEYTTGLPVTGDAATGALPNNVTLAVKLASGLTGRSNRGRQYLLGIPVNTLDSDKNHVTAGYASDIKGAYDALISDLISYGVELVIASFFSGGVPRTTASTHLVGSTSVDTTLDSQRRRLPGRGA